MWQGAPRSKRCWGCRRRGGRATHHGPSAATFCRGYSQSNGDLVQRYRELAEVVTVERALRIGRLLERESFRHFDVEGTGLDQAINFLKRRILILSVICLDGDAGMIFLRQLNTVRIGDPSTATQRG